MSDAITSQLPLDTLALTIKAHVTKGDASIEKAEQHYKAAGIHLMDAKQRISHRRDITWPKWLLENCSVRRRRADELIAIANGTTSLAELRERNAASKRESRASNRAGRPAKSSRKAQQNQQTTTSDEAEDGEEALSRSPQAILISKIVADLKCLDVGDLEDVWAFVQQRRSACEVS